MSEWWDGFTAGFLCATYVAALCGLVEIALGLRRRSRIQRGVWNDAGQKWDEAER